MSKPLLEDEKDDQLDENDEPPFKRRRNDAVNSANKKTGETTTSLSTSSVNKQQIKSNNQLIRLNLLACGVIRKYLTNRNISHVDIAQIVAKFLFPDWKFDYCYDYNWSRGSTHTHGIETPGE